MDQARPKLLALAPNCDGTDVGEAWRAFKWTQALAEHCDITLLTFQREGRPAVRDQLPGVEVISWPEPAMFGERFGAMLKPAYMLYYQRVRQWLQKAALRGRRFDIAHQITPAALRYPTPLVGAGIPYVLGPLGGSVETPAGLRAECRSAAWYTQLRRLDGLRLQHDPLLRRSFAEASLVIGVAPYVEELLGPIKTRQFMIHSEMAIDELAPAVACRREPGSLRLLHVGRAVRTKGLRDVVRAMGKLSQLPGVTLDSAGDGEEIALCRAEAESLGIADRIRFHGHLPRQEVERLYASSDLFVFPSFREPSGRVISEAMRWGLPVLAADCGGPGHVVNASCGFKVAAENPEQLASDIANVIQRVAERPYHLVPMRAAARKKVAREGLWPAKAKTMLSAYQDVLAAKAGEAVA